MDQQETKCCEIGQSAGAYADPLRNERRRHARVPIALSVTVASASNFYEGLTENMSEAGVFVATDLAEPIGSKIALLIALDDGVEPPLSLTGEVRWLRDCAPRGMGVLFEELSACDRQRIRVFLQRRDPMFFEE